MAVEPSQGHFISLRRKSKARGQLPPESPSRFADVERRDPSADDQQPDSSWSLIVAKSSGLSVLPWGSDYPPCVTPQTNIYLHQP